MIHVFSKINMKKLKNDRQFLNFFDVKINILLSYLNLEIKFLFYLDILKFTCFIVFKNSSLFYLDNNWTHFLLKMGLIVPKV